VLLLIDSEELMHLSFTGLGIQYTQTAFS